MRMNRTTTFVKLEVVTKIGGCASDFAKDTIKVGALPDADFFVSNLHLVSFTICRFYESAKSTLYFGGIHRSYYIH
jgi:hypothetical protein